VPKKIITIVVPTYNEEGNVDLIYAAIKHIIPTEYAAEFIFVDDGSRDRTPLLIKKLAKLDKRVHYLFLTRNFGHQYALKAGLDYATGAAVITMDADLEHPASSIPLMIKEWRQGYKIVYTQRADDSHLSIPKRLLSRFFYRFINLLSDVHISENSPDFRLIDRVVVEMIKHTQESSLFLRGMVMWGGYPAKALTYRQTKREWGESKYTYPKMLHLALDAITSFSTVPLRLATIIGLFMSLFSGIYGIYAVVVFLVDRQNVIIGWPSVIISVLFIGGLQLLILGIIGEYIGKIFLETKKRPLYLIQEKNI
jgi:dolichol-phosphate mannosyltransferase